MAPAPPSRIVTTRRGGGTSSAPAPSPATMSTKRRARAATSTTSDPWRARPAWATTVTTWAPGTSSRSTASSTCRRGSREGQGRGADLAAPPARCTLAYWHEPRFVSGTVIASNPKYQTLWDTLYQYGADVVVNGHRHSYERFAPQSPAEVADPTFGIREVVVGTGGGSLDGDSPAPELNSEVKDGNTWGVIKFTLNDGSYDWQFVPVEDQTFTDAGTNCQSYE